MGLIYLLALLGSAACMLLIDFRHRLFLFHRPRAAALVLLLGTVFFLLWDVAGIGLGIFLSGESRFDTGIMLGPEMPLEEPVFLMFLVLCTMVVYTGAVRVLTHLRRPRGPRGAPAAEVGADGTGGSGR
ncbi:MAG: lycopene cyclase domain-containing protein [Nesterenkonia sp.]|nr:lycopene cyclase domain-containing protein [Nesterenkonia sp.]